jgi:hypothetical protein
MMYSTIREREDALKEARRGWPRLPSALALHLIGKLADGPGDWEVGKRMQGEPGVDVPYECESEKGAGMWDRITHGEWREHVLQKATPE